ncbi:branched-chain amino acid ABC transporter permease [Arthrobacter roseus]|uniref:branched-chain amino acid ABC transporter permease n=1 Tax=Arthrobacter roseus TaxID=136274 RepID=UPI0019626A5A|nr:branched-chain amino acid ABC transporter permease [Arthrobacter roseus]MBM7847881.1 branched-chain amino acid transport system permease protein [Arthrobacter roseus]
MSATNTVSGMTAGRLGTQKLLHPSAQHPMLRLAVAVIILVVLVALPFVLAPYPLSLAGRALAFGLLVVSVDLLTGVMGMPTLGQVAYFGAGAYTAGLVGIHVSGSGLVQLAVGTLAGAALALVTGAVAVRTAGIVFLMITLAIGELAHISVGSLSVVGASNGLAGIPPVSVLPGGEPLIVPGYIYWWVLAVFVIGFVAATIVNRSPLGRSMRGVRDGELRLRALGQNTYSIKLIAYTIAGGVAGAAGTAWVAQTQFISPGDLGFDMAAFALLSVVLGGAGSLWGPVIGAGLVIFVRDWLGGYIEGRGTLLLGVVFVVAVYLLPRGVAGIKWRALRRKSSES